MHAPTPMNDTTTKRPKAYSYVRFSTPEQERGDSYRRQTEVAQRYCQKHGWDLDTELRFHDRGVSAFRGRNAAVGALGDFKRQVADGTVPQGSYLIVESLDRISRQTARRALRTLEDIVEKGVSVVDLSDGGKVYDTDALDDPWAFMMMIMRFVRAHEESAMKSMRLQNVYEEKRRVAANGEPQTKPFTRMLPGWLQWNDDGKRHEVIEERADILRDIFAKADAGWSKHRIARALNEAGVEPWGFGKRKGRHWRSSYIQKLMTNTAVVGTFTPHRVTKADGGARIRTPENPIVAYFPAVIDQDVFARVSAQAKARSARGRHADNAPRSVFSGLLRCARCGGSVVRVSKGKYVYLVCDKAHQRGACKYLAVRYKAVEGGFLHKLSFLHDWAPWGQDTAEIEAEIQKVTGNIDAGSDIVEELVELAATEKSDAARHRLRVVEEELAVYETRLRELKARRDAMSSAAVIRRLEAIRDAVSREPMIIGEVNKALKEAISKIVFDPEEPGLIVWWHHAEKPSGPIYFPSRHNKPFDEPVDPASEA